MTWKGLETLEISDFRGPKTVGRCASQVTFYGRQICPSTGDKFGAQPNVHRLACHAVGAFHWQPSAGASMLRSDQPTRRAHHAFAAAFAATLGLVVTGALSLRMQLVRKLDNVVEGHLLDMRHGRLGDVALAVVHACDRAPYALLGAGLVLIALARRRWMLACVVPVVLAASVLTTETLKPFLATQRGARWLHPAVGAASWPSGHASAALALGFCAVLVAPARLRRGVALLVAVFIAALAWATLVFGGHLPSDLLGGYLVSAVWGMIGLACLLLRARPA
jgi:membrane-associated phospholipid phosphatase